MDNTHVQAPEPSAAAVGPAPALAPIAAAPSVVRRTGMRLWAYKTLQTLASLRITVVLFVLSIILVFCGTLAQVDGGIWTVVAKYFRSFYVWIPFQIFAPRSQGYLPVSGGFPFPGGWLLGSLLLVNLLAAHAIRFKATWKRSGIILLHAGLIVIMLGELITGLFAVEGSMLIYQGGSTNFVMHPRESELAVIFPTSGDTGEVVVIPMAFLRRTGEPIKHDALPFDVEVLQYMVNCRVCKQKMPEEFVTLAYGDLPDAPPGADNPASTGVGLKYYVAVPLPESGGIEQSKEDQAGAYVRFRHKGTGKDLGTYMLSALLQDEPQYVTVDGKKYDVRLRLKRSYKPYTMTLIQFRHDKYVGTEKPKNFSSYVHLTDPSRNEDRKVHISMNDPLRYGGETFYQQSFLSGDRATILQVVQNPGWLMPYISCVMVAVGMLIHFGFKMQSFLERRAAQ
jgi:hypothetical protein